MAFNSFLFAAFAPAVFIVYYYLKDRYRWMLLLASSFAFYAALLNPFLIGILSLVILVSYFSGISINKCTGNKRNISLWSGIILDIIILIAVKYPGFLFSNINSALNVFSPGFTFPEIGLMPSIGVSFYVFQAISYLADVYLEKIEAEKHFGYLALYLSFFPKLLQGPIERGASLLPQLHTQYKFDYETAKNGLVLFAWGLFKKVAIADRLAVFVNFVYETPKEFSGPVLILATVLFAFQIYYDFSGYTDMALGIARLFNIRLTQNFRTPYFSYSIADFWRRWHITFSGWLQDYLFIPFQIIFRGMGSAGTAISLLITFFICGLWHGANWTFIIWGILNGIYLSLYFLTKNLRAKAGRFFMLGKAPRLTTVLQVVTTFIFVCFSWIFFRANCIDNALYIVTHIFSGFGTLFDAVIRHRIDSIRMAISFGGSRFSRFDIYALLISLFLYFICELSQAKMGNKEIGQYLSEKSSFTRWAVYYMLIFGIIFWGALGSSIQPIYFQF